MISCRQVYEKASDFIDQPPGPWMKIKLRLHLIICKHCRRYMRQLGMASHACAELAHPPLPDDEAIDRLITQLKSQN